MDDSRVTVRDLRNRGGDVLDRVANGEELIVTRDGEPVAALRPLRRPGLTSNVLLARWRHVPPIDAGRLRADIDEVLDPSM